MNNILRNINQVAHTTTWSFDPPFIHLTIAVDINEYHTERTRTRHLIYLEQQYTILVSASQATRLHINGPTRTGHRLCIVIHYIDDEIEQRV
jgi:hypothetical protein